MTVGSGASITTSGTGTIVATQVAASAVAYVTGTIASGSATGTTTACAAGFKIIGGGVTGGTKGISSSGPTASNAWTVTFLNNTTTTATITGVCLKTP